MTVLSAQTLRWYKPVTPFVNRTLHEETGTTYGLSACGYDIRVREELSIPAHGFVLASSIERFQMTDDLVGIVHDKSTWARRGLAVQNTVIEPGWCGFLTLEITNNRDHSISVPAGAPIAQVIFHRLDCPTDRPYAGKYQDQPARPVEAIQATREDMHARIDDDVRRVQSGEPNVMGDLSVSVRELAGSFVEFDRTIGNGYPPPLAFKY